MVAQLSISKQYLYELSAQVNVCHRKAVIDRFPTINNSDIRLSELFALGQSHFLSFILFCILRGMHTNRPIGLLIYAKLAWWG